MHVATLRPHPTDPNLAILAVPSDLNTTIGRFEPARLSNQHKGYLVHTTDIDTLGRFLRINNIAVADERATLTTDTPPKYHRHPSAVLKCGTCEWTQRPDSCDDDCGHCHRCHQCQNPDLRSHLVTVEEQIAINARGMAKVKTEMTGPFVKELDW